MKNKRLIISWSLLIGWMLLIFFMSNQPADISTKQSDLVIKIFSTIGIDLNTHLGEIASFVVRKAAHFTEYFILYCFSINVCKHYFEIKRARIYCLLIVLVRRANCFSELLCANCVYWLVIAYFSFFFMTCF